MFKEGSHQANSITLCIKKTLAKTKINRVPNESCNDIPKQQQQYKIKKWQQCIIGTVKQ